MRELLTVRLGVSLRTPWAIPPSEYGVIGNVYRGMEFGFLAIAPGGVYVQVNGSAVQPLNQDDVNAAICAERLRAAKPCEQPIEPVVTVRKRRRIPATEGAA